MNQSKEFFKARDVDNRVKVSLSYIVCLFLYLFSHDTWFSLSAANKLFILLKNMPKNNGTKFQSKGEGDRLFRGLIMGVSSDNAIVNWPWKTEGLLSFEHVLARPYCRREGI